MFGLKLFGKKKPKKKEKKRTVHCSVCGGEGHTARKCPEAEKPQEAPIQ